MEMLAIFLLVILIGGLAGLQSRLSNTRRMRWQPIAVRSRPRSPDRR